MYRLFLGIFRNVTNIAVLMFRWPCIFVQGPAENPDDF